MIASTSGRKRSVVLGAAFSVAAFLSAEPASAQAPPVQINPIIPPTTQAIATVAESTIGPQQAISGATGSGLVQAAGGPPLNPPLVGALPSGIGALTLDQWVVTATLGLYTLYNSNIYGSAISPVAAPGFNMVPSLLADYNTGIWDTKVYANVNTTIYPTLAPANNNYNWQGGFTERYSPLRDLVFTLQGNATHSSYASFVTNSLPTPIISPATPALPGAAGILATQQLVVNPNDTYSVVGNVYKEFNRAFMSLGSSFSTTQYEGSGAGGTFLPNYEQKSYYGSGGFWFTPQLYAFGNGIEAFTDPSGGPDASSYQISGGIGTAPISLFSGTIYFGRQGSAVVGDGTAGGDLFGATISYVPTDALNTQLSVSHVENISNITALPAQGAGLGGLSFVAVPVPITDSAQITTVSLTSNYTWSAQTSISGVLSNSRIAFIGSPRVDNSWLASVGIQHRLSQNLLLTANYSYNSYVSPVPFTSVTIDLITVGAVYNF
jgi:hypothetical protein